MTNWMTTVGGIVAAVPAVWDIVQTVANYHWSGNWQTDLTGVGALVVGLLAKDFNVTGGTKQQ